MNEHHIKEDFYRILRLLSSADDLTQRDVSAHLDISLGKTNYLLKALIGKGFIKIRNFATRDQKLKKVKYILTKTGFEEKVQLTYYFLKKKEEEYLALKKELEAMPDENTAAGTAEDTA
ncbi:MAG: MarR family EPS-associated transcriptional regulator [Candidatus Omnitrophica bacterium]|nr:MarR family EPS-associated transcriptional regulator [Candidatus Omnitrophota bacterium]MDD5488843.1 MarR family EPS-associated transcriptional regulator [Candidatus Omnitrophota bacterium]